MASKPVFRGWTISVFADKDKETKMLDPDYAPKYAIFWLDNGVPGNGEFVLDEATLRAWLGRLRFRYPEMQHWGELPNGERYIEVDPIPLSSTI